MNGKEKYIASKAYKRPVGSFTQRDNVRDFARSGHGQNYHKMMDLHQQLPTMTKDDPRVQEFKDRRRSFNRYGKYPMGEMLGMSPLDMQKKYVGLSRDVRQTNKPVYNKMYPIEGGYMDYTQGGGLPGLILKGAKSLVGNIVGMGRDILGGDGINGADRDVSQKELDDYAAKTFGFYPFDVHPGLPIEDETSLVDEKTREEQIQELVDEEQRKIDNFETDYHSDLLDDMAKDQWPTSGYRFEFDDYVQDRIDALKKKSPEKSEKRIDKTDWGELDDKKEDYIRRQNEYIPPISAELGEPNPQLNFPESEYTGPMPDISIEFGPYDEKQVLPEIKPYNPGWREYGILQNQGLVRGSELRPLEQEYSEYVRWSLAGGQEPVRYEDFLRYSSKPRGPHVGETYRSPSSMRN